MKGWRVKVTCPELHSEGRSVWQQPPLPGRKQLRPRLGPAGEFSSLRGWPGGEELTIGLPPQCSLVLLVSSFLFEMQARSFLRGRNPQTPALRLVGQGRDSSQKQGTLWIFVGRRRCKQQIPVTAKVVGGRPAPELNRLLNSDLLYSLAPASEHPFGKCGPFRVSPYPMVGTPWCVR